MPALIQEIPVPSALAAILAHHQSELESSGHPAEVSKRMAERIARHAGWFQTKLGWKKLHKDLSDKVNIRHADVQPDGRYLVRDVDVFYPNAVKAALEIGPDGELSVMGTKQYKPEDVRGMIENTNRGINAGGQKPALTRGHPSAQQKAIGVSLPSLGQGFNWRESPRGKGWARCDILVEPELFADWRDGKITGLSAGIVQDAGGLNRRFGHIAALGAESQALSALPTTEVFSVADQVCFSAEPAAFVQRSPGKSTKLKGAHKMKMTPKQAGALKDCYSAYAAALSSYEAGEPESEGKLAEAREALSAKHKEFGAEDEIPGTMPTETGAPAGPAATPAAPMATHEMPAAPEPEVAGEYEATSEEEFNTAPDVAFAKSLRNQQKMLKQLNGLANRSSTLERENQLLRTKTAMDKFSAELEAVAKDYIYTDFETAKENFAASKFDPAVAARIIARAKTAPRRISAAPAMGMGARGRAATEEFAAESDKDVVGRMGQELGSDFSTTAALLGMKMSG